MTSKKLKKILAGLSVASLLSVGGVGMHNVQATGPSG